MYRMLIVDDERIIRETLSHHIDWAALDVQVIGTASNGWKPTTSSWTSTPTSS